MVPVAGAGALAVLGAGGAGAMTPYSGDGWNAVVLTPEETAVAGQLGVGNLLDAASGNSKVIVSGDGSRKVVEGSPTIDELIDMAAAHPGGSVSLGWVDSARFNVPPLAIRLSWP